MSIEKNCFFEKTLSKLKETLKRFGYFWCVVVVLSAYLVVNMGLILLPTYLGLTETPHFVGIFTTESLLLTIFACSHRAKTPPKFVTKLFTGVPKIDLLNILSICTASLCVITSFDPSSMFFSISLCVIATIGFFYLFLENKKHKRFKAPVRINLC